MKLLFFSGIFGFMAYLPVVVRTTIADAIQLIAASAAAIAVVCVMSAGRGVRLRSSSNS